jgi:tetratricopeptide (TPR) repeat protein
MSNQDKNHWGDRHRSAEEAFRRATEAMQKGNWEPACRLFRQCVDLVPENLLFRQSLRGATEKMYGNNRTGASMAGMRLMGIKASIKKSQMSKDWNGVIQACEDGLAINPWDPSLNANLGEALSNVGLIEPARFCYERAVQGDPGNELYRQMLAKLKGDDDDFSAGVLCKI